MSTLLKMMQKTEKIAALVAIVGLLFTQMHLPASNILLVVGFLSLSVVYWTFLLTPMENVSRANNIIIRVSYLSLSAGLLAIIYQMLHWPGARIFTIVSLLAMFACIMLLIFSSKKNEYEAYIARGIMLRVAIVGLVITMAALRGNA